MTALYLNIFFASLHKAVTARYRALFKDTRRSVCTFAFSSACIKMRYCAAKVARELAYCNGNEEGMPARVRADVLSEMKAWPLSNNREMASQSKAMAWLK